nr:leukotriene B4 receptor 2a [Solea senegalensis]
MADIYQYPVFFDCPVLLEERQRRRVQNYLSLRNKSGGGDCGRLTRVNDTVYSIAYWRQKDQQSVLQKREHVVELSGGPLVFTVRASLEPDTSAPITTSTMNPHLTLPAQSTAASIPPSSGEEYELQCDTYLLNYLKESDKARKELDTELASMACTAQFYPEKGRVLVRRLAHPAAADEGTNWKAEVDRLFDGYLCHFEVDSHKIKALLKYCSSHLSSDQVKVYDEIGMAVVVGKHAQVTAALMDVEDYALKFQGSSLNETHTTTLRLGEAKLRLLWRELENGLREKCPGVKVTQRDASQVVLEGPVREILKAGEWISEKASLVSERTVSKLSPHLLAFLRKAYGGQGMLGDFLQLGDEVEIELQDRELRLFSIFVDKLDVAEAALQAEFKEVDIDVPNCYNLSVELQRILKSKTNEMNQWQCRANVLFNSNSTICLLGHTKEVEDLNQTVTEFILLKSIPFSELAQELLRQPGFDFSEVTFHPFKLSSEPRLVLEGPSSKVTDLRNLLGEFLDPSEMHPVQGQNNSKQVASSLDEGIVASYTLCDGLQVVVCHGDITKQDAEALVNAANEDLDHCRGLAAALSGAGGPEVQRESNDIVKRNGKIPIGEVVTTTGGDLRCQRLLHAVGPVAGDTAGRGRLLLEKTIHSALNKAEGMAMYSIAIPCISSGVFGAPICSEAIVTAVKEFGNQEERESLRKIILIDNREEVVRAMQEACDRLLQRNSSRFGPPSESEFHMHVDSQYADRGATAGPPADSVHFEVVQEVIEKQRVDVVVCPMVGNNPFSTNVGRTLAEIVGSQLTAGFKKEAGQDLFPGDAVLVEGFRGHPFNAVFFLNLCSYDGDEDGGAVQVLRMGIKQVLSSCENHRFGSVAFPVVGAGMLLEFPRNLVARVLLEEIREFKQNQLNRTPEFLIRIAIHPNDTEATEVFKEFLKDTDQPDQVSTPTRIFLLGKTGSGKSTLANSIFGEENLFPTSSSFTSKTTECKVETRTVRGRDITLIDTPGYFDTDRQEEEIRSQMMRGITECAPGPHVFLIVLKIERFTQQEQAVISEIQRTFSEDALRFAVVVFTHGDQLAEGSKIQDLIRENRNLDFLVQKCGGRYIVFNNNPQKNKLQGNYSSKQVEDLLSTINKMNMENNGGYYTNKMLQEVRDDIWNEVTKMALNITTRSPFANDTIVDDRVGTITGALILSLVFLVGLPGNVFVIWSILARARKQSITTLLILNLAIADGSLMALTPFFIVYLALKKWVFQRTMCKILFYLCLANMYASIHLIMLMSLYRFMAILWPQRISVITGRRTVLRVLAGLWVVVIVASIPAVIYRETKNMGNTVVCDSFHAEPKDTILQYSLELVLGCFIPYSVILVSYLCILRRIRQTKFRRRIRSEKLILAIVLTFCLLWLPYHVINMVQVSWALCPEGAVKNTLRNIWHSSRAVTASIAFISSSVNPVLYFFAGKSYIRREGLAFMARLFEGAGIDSGTRKSRNSQNSRDKDKDQEADSVMLKEKNSLTNSSSNVKPVNNGK